MALVFIALLLLSAAFVLGGCSKDKDVAGANGSRLEVRLTDAPSNFEQVNVDVRAVQIHVSNSDEEANWQSLTLLRPGVINLLDLAGGRDVLLASADFPAGRISQLRLVLGPNNTVKLKGDPALYELKTPSAQQSGLKLKIDADLTRDVTYQVMLDFDAGKSVVERGNSADRFSLKPVIRTITTAIAGGVRGQVAPADDFASTVYLLKTNGDTAATSPISPTSGSFLLRGITAGTYNLRFNGAGSHDGDVKNQAVTVTSDRITDVGTVRF